MLKSMLVAALLASAPGAAHVERDRENSYTGDRICRVQPVIGSRLGGRRVCKTQAEWDEMERAARDGVREAQNRQVAPTVDRYPGVPNGMGGTPR